MYNLIYELDVFPAILDEDNGYVGVNITSASMTGFDKSDNALSNVPGYRLSAECVPGTVNYVRLQPGDDKYMAISSNMTYDRIIVTSEVSQEMGWGSSTYYYFSDQKDGITSILPNSAFTTWSSGSTSFNVIYIMSGIHQQALHTDYGNPQPAHQYKGDFDRYGV